jgi:2-desacetyl-2-hydroxyethyl bacteriochlorophyllide A dehydrogenase
MKAIVLDGPGRLTLVEVPPAGRPAAHEALVRVRRVGVCGTDLHAFKGEQPFVTYPRVLGHELGVEVVGVGEGVEGLRAGDRCAVEPFINCGGCVACRRGKTNCCERLRVLGVHANGGMRETLIVPADKLHKSETLSFDQLALVEPLCIGAHAVARAQVEQGESVVVIGAGPIGLSVIQFACAAGARVTVLDVNEERLGFAREHFQVAAVIKVEDDVLEQVREVAVRGLPTAVFDATGSLRSMNAAFDLVAYGGRLVLVGFCQGAVTFDDAGAHRRELTLMCSRNATREDFKRVVSLLEAGAVNIEPWITHRVAFGDAAVGQFPLWLNPQSRFIKAVIEL